MHIYFILVEAVLIGAPYAFPGIPPLIGQAMFWIAAAGLVLYPLVQFWRARRMLEPQHLIIVGLIGVIVFASIALAGVVWQQYWPHAGAHRLTASDIAEIEGNTSKEIAKTQRDPPETPSAAERHAAERAAFLQRRDHMEAPLREIGGTLVDYAFPENGIGQAKIEVGDSIYVIPLSVHGGTGVWIYNEHETIKALYKIGKTSRGELIDLQMFRAAKRSEPLEIGDTAIIEAADGKLIEILIVAVRYHGAGDEKERVSFRYKIHSPDDQPIKSL